MPKITIIIPIYKVEQYIEKCARSLFDQTIDDVEYIFIDDCSPDNSISILEQVLKDYPTRKHQTVILHNANNLGQIGTRRRGIMKATGEFVIHCDSDDWVDSDMYKALYEEAKNKDADLVWCDMTRIADDGTTRYVSSRSQGTVEDSLYALVDGRRFSSLCTHLVRRDIAQSPRIMWPTWNYCEDLSLIFQYTALSSRLSYITKSFYWYRDNMQSISHVKDPKKVIANTNGAIKAVQSELECSKWLGLYDEMKPVCIAEIIKAKGRVLKISRNEWEACRLWNSLDDDINLFDIWNCSLSVSQKLLFTSFYLYLYPIKGVVKKLIKLT